MTATLPADVETERLARRVAEATGKPLPLVVREAIASEAAKAGVVEEAAVSREGLIARMTSITEVFARLPVLDERSADAIVGYDEHGLPQ